MARVYITPHNEITKDFFKYLQDNGLADTKSSKDMAALIDTALTLVGKLVLEPEFKNNPNAMNNMISKYCAPAIRIKELEKQIEELKKRNGMKIDSNITNINPGHTVESKPKIESVPIKTVQTEQPETNTAPQNIPFTEDEIMRFCAAEILPVQESGIRNGKSVTDAMHDAGLDIKIQKMITSGQLPSDFVIPDYTEVIEEKRTKEKKIQVNTDSDVARQKELEQQAIAGAMQGGFF